MMNTTLPILASALMLAHAPLLIPGCDEQPPAQAAARPELSSFPAEQVETMRARLAALREMESIVSSSQPEADKIAALRAMAPRLRELNDASLGMSYERQRAIIAALGLKWSVWQLSFARILVACGEEGSPLMQAAQEGLDTLFNDFGDWKTRPASETAAALLRRVDELEQALARPGLSRDDRLELLRLYREHLLYISAPLYLGEDRGRAHTQAVEQWLAARPEAVAKLEAHLARMKPVTAAEADEDMAWAEENYESELRGFVVYRLAELTAEGRQEMAAIRDFLRGSEQVALGQLSLNEDGGKPCLTMFLRPEVPSEDSKLKLIDLYPTGSEEEFETFCDREDYGSGLCLLRFSRAELTTAADAQASLRALPPLRELPQRLHPLPDGWDKLHRILETNPGLREKLYLPQ